MSEKGIVHLRCAEIRETQPPAAPEFPPLERDGKRRAKHEREVKKTSGGLFCQQFTGFSERPVFFPWIEASLSAAPASIHCQQCGQIKT
jgi:hypothetical protein